MLSLRSSSLRSVRSIHSSPYTAKSFSDWLSFMNINKKKEQEKQNKLAIEQSLQDIESKDAKMSEEIDNLTTDKTTKLSDINLNDLQTIGAPTTLSAVEAAERLNGFKVDRWITNSFKKITTEEQLDSSLLEAWNSVNPADKIDSIDSLLQIQLSDLPLRFQYFKKIQQLTGHQLSDLLFTSASTIQEFKTYFLKHVITNNALKFNDRTPDALIFDESSFADLPNVIIENSISRKEMKKRYSDLLKQVKQAEA